MKGAVFTILVSCSLTMWSVAQGRLSVKEGQIEFASNAKLELIKAYSKEVQGVVNTTNNQFAFLVKVKSFGGFNSKLQQEHFNEKYLEADKYYDATFVGKITESIDFTKDGEYDAHANGTLTIHGKKQPRDIPAKIKIQKGAVVILSDFSVLLKDHDIKIPEIVNTKIATEIFVKVNLTMIAK